MFSLRVLRNLPRTAARIYGPLRRPVAYSTLASDNRVSSEAPHPGNNLEATSDFVTLQTKPVPDAPQSLAFSPVAFLDYIRKPSASPLIFRASEERGRHARTNGQEFLQTLRASGDRLVEIEAGRDVQVSKDLRLPHDYRTSVTLNMYLDWLCGNQVGFPNAPWYLAQWLARDEVPGLAELVRPPQSLLAPLIEESKADLYQTGFFIGPASAMSPLHYDPYENLYTLHTSSDASVHGKHWLLLPPSLRLSPQLDRYMQPNMSALDFRLRRRRSGHRSEELEGSFDILVNRASVPGDAAQRVLDAETALSCVMREGDMLFVPRRWWHRVENVVLQDGGNFTPEGNSGQAAGWTVGVGWWFLPRSLQHKS